MSIIEIEIAILENQTQSISPFLELSVTRFQYRIVPEEPAIGTRGHRMGFTPHESDHAECGGVYVSANPIMLSTEEFISSTLNIGAKNRNQINIKFFI